MTLSCDDADALLAAHALGDDAAAADAALSDHLAACADCRARASHHAEVVSALPLAAEPHAPPARLRSRVLAAVHAESLEPQGAAGSPWWRRAWLRVPASRGLSTAGAIACLAVVVIIGANMTATPAMLHATASGAAAAPQARAELVMDRSTHMAMVHLSGAPATASAVYELWDVDASGGVQAAGPMSAQPDGSYVAAAMVPPGTMALRVTREPAGSEVSPQGPEVVELSVG